jgi:hypothetical protein
VAANALEARVTAFERVAGFAMIEIVDVRVPADGNELLAVVLGVALAAFVVGMGGGHEGWVKSSFRGEALADFGMTAGAFELALSAAADVAVGAMGGAIEFGMRFGKGARRELRAGEHRAAKEREDDFRGGGGCPLDPSGMGHLGD